ncbi:hypothetical protein PRIPAC_93059 [Pristionchus pacificus]|uniref:Uncharacterized protein n=1 Tax=Pristionchus pacificus TaxID=54126 RepID=A0A2A6BJ05_PRIPA|nr:hypothetical protein PRIPAC_93059 [Pristionchus pacificus]|eukprot:PDM65890.1 hypothetical protein PRIPAC_44169 [Pristionchus pacificus]
MICCTLYFMIIFSSIAYAVMTCGKSPSKVKRKIDKTPEPTPPEGVPLGGSGERDDDTLRNVPSLTKGVQKEPPLSS